MYRFFTETVVSLYLLEFSCRFSKGVVRFPIASAPSPRVKEISQLPVH